MKLPDEDLIRERVEYAMEVGKPLRPAYSELRSLLIALSCLLTANLVMSVIWMVLRLTKHI